MHEMIILRPECLWILRWSKQASRVWGSSRCDGSSTRWRRCRTCASQRLRWRLVCGASPKWWLCSPSL